MSGQLQGSGPEVTCPNCGRPFALTKALAGPIEAEVARRLEAEYTQRDQEREADTKRRIAQASAKAAERAVASQETEVKALKEQVVEQQQRISNLQTAELGLRQRARALEAREREVPLQIERQVDARLKSVEAEVAKRLHEAHHLKEAEKDKVISDLREQLADAVRVAQQGSQQVQGEVAELDLEAQLRKAFPQDEFEPVKNGQRGADLLHRVRDGRGAQAGCILYETKNTRAFSDGWIAKLREDQRSTGAELAVLVSATLPKEIPTFAQRGGVWITGLVTSLPLASALRAGLLEASRQRVVAEGQAGKQASLLTYCGGTEFRQRVEAMLDPLAGLIEDLEKERRSIEAAWARRQKRHDQLVHGIAGLYGDVAGIIGTLPRLPRLELPPGEEAA